MSRAGPGTEENLNSRRMTLGVSVSVPETEETSLQSVKNATSAW